MGDADLKGAVLDGRYQVIEPIAEGAMGSVYRGERLQLGRAVAIKVMHQELPDELASRQRFEREAKLMALLEHPNCVSVIDFGLHDDKPFLVMDLVRGTSLIDLLEKQGQLDVARAADIIRQVLSGLAHAHELGIVHRDIKPANIMISEKAGLGQQVRILDFGLARLTESSTKLTTGIVVGTPNYMAPEQCKGSDVDARTDIYACGVMLFEMLTGRKPFIADDPIVVVRKHLLEKPPTLASVEPRVDFGELEDVVAKALAKAPADRFASAVDMSKAVEAAAAKVARAGAAALYARAVPEASTPPIPANQQATMTGWNVPPDARSSAIPPPDDGSTALSPSTRSGPVAGIASVGEASGGFHGTPSIDPSTSGASGPTSSSGFGSAPAAALPSLPQAAPYTAPEGWTAPTPAPGAPMHTPPSGTPTARPTDTPSTGTPNATLDVPATRPSTLPPTPARGGAPTDDRPIPALPLTKKQLLIGGSALFGLIVVIALVAGGGKKGGATSGTGAGGTTSATAEKPTAESVAPQVERAKALIASEEYEDAIDLLKTARKANPQNAELAFLAGRAYFGKLYWSDGIDSFRSAIKLDASYRDNDELLKTVLKGFLTTPDVDDRIADFIEGDLRETMKPYLQETADKHPKKNLRARARAELERL